MKAGSCSMWKCSACQNENKDEYRFCLSCGSPRPSGKAPKAKKPGAEPKKEGNSRAMTILLLVLALLLVIAIVGIIIYFPTVSGKTEPAKEESGESSQRHSRGEKAADKSEWGGSSSYIIGGDTDAAPESFVPSSDQALPVETPVSSALPVETPVPTAEPLSEYLIPGSDSRYITEADLKELSWEQCCLARNEIFARHGRMFQTPEIASYFNSKSWYHGTIAAENFSETVLNEYERANVNYIRQYETAHWGGSYY